MKTWIVGIPLALTVLTPLSAELNVEFEDRGITVRGVSPGGTLALMGVAKAPQLYYSETTYIRELLTDRDADGVVSYEFGKTVPERSLWILADLASGEYTAAAPEEESKREAPFPHEDSLRDDGGGDYTVVADERAAIEVLYVRPRDGGWHAAATDGGSSDRDGLDDGRVKLYLEDLEELGGGKRQLADIAPGDIILGIDPYVGEFFTYEIDAPDGR